MFRATSILLIAAFCGLSHAEAQDPLKVGVIVPLSGDAASIGASCSNGINLGLEKLDTETRGKLEVVFEDDALDPKSSISVFHKLITVSDVDAVLCVSSGVGNVLAPLAEDARRPMVAVGASDHRVSKGRRYALTFWVSPEEEARLIVPEIRRRGYQQIVQVVSQQDGMLTLRDAVNHQGQGRFEVVLSEDFLTTDKDFRTFISRIKHRPETDAVMLFLLPGQLGLFAFQARQQKLNLPLFGVETLEDAAEVKLSKGALVGAWYVNAADGDENFTKEYYAKFPGAPIFIASNCHDTALLLAAAVRAHGRDRERVNEFLHTVNGFRGALGVFSASGDNRFTLPAELKVVTADGFERLPR